MLMDCLSFYERHSMSCLIISESFFQPVKADVFVANWIIYFTTVLSVPPSSIKPRLHQFLTLIQNNIVFTKWKFKKIFLITRRRHVFLMDQSLVVCLSTSGMESQSFSASWQIRRCHLNVSIYSLSVLWGSFIFDISYWFFWRACDGKLVVHCFTQLPTSLLE